MDNSKICRICKRELPATLEFFQKDKHSLSSKCKKCKNEYLKAFRLQKYGPPKYTRHGCTDTPEWTSWHSMIQRCGDKNCRAYPYYGGRGIKVCERWIVFQNFLADMGTKPTPQHTLDRYPNNNGNYEPSNCRWATRKEQQNNRRVNTLLEHRGEIHTAAEWASILNLDYSTLISRLQCGWTVENALTRPIRRHTKKHRNTLIAFNGESLTLKGWADKSGIPFVLLNQRITRGWTIERALTTPPQK